MSAKKTVEEESQTVLEPITPHNPKFMGTSILLSDPELFDKPMTDYLGSTVIPKIENPFLNDEVRSYIEDAIVNKHLTYGSAKQYINHLRGLSFICTGPEYAKVRSIAEIDKNVFIRDVIKGLRSHGYEITQSSHERLNSMMRFYEWVHDIRYPHNGFRFEDDIWRTEDLIEKFHPPAGPQRIEHIYFNNLNNPWLKDAAKHFFLWRINAVSISTNVVSIYYLGYLDAYMQEHGLSDLSKFNRDDAEELIGMIHDKRHSSSAYNNAIGAIELFLNTIALRKLPGSSATDVFLKMDRAKTPGPDPHPYSDREIAEILNYAKELPPIISDALLLLILQGYRSIDLCAAKILKPDGTPALVKDENDKDGGWMIYLCQYKTRKWSLFPLQDASASILLHRIEISKQEYGSDCTYIFATGHDDYLRTDHVRQELKKMVKTHGLKGDDGQPLPITKLHRFRQTVASSLIRLTNDPEMVRIFLGHIDEETLSHYVAVSQAEQLSSMKKIHEENDMLIQNLGSGVNVLEDNHVPDDAGEKRLIPLSNGYCGKAGSDICSHANACLSCPMFVTSKKYLQVYQYQRRELMIAQTTAEIEGYDTIAEHDEEMIKRLDKIIAKITGEGIA